MHPLMNALLLSTALLCGACDTIFRFAGRVTTPSGLPAAGADVWLDCGEGPTVVRNTTDQAGRFELRGMGAQPASCRIRVQAAGYAATAIPIMSVCREPLRRGDACRELVVDPLVLEERQPQ